jgi:hypothetical protein
MIKAEIVMQYDYSAQASLRYRVASEAGIKAAGDFFLKELKRAYTNYYTTQNFRDTIFIRGSLKAARPERARNGWYTVVGVPSEMVVPVGQNRAVDRGKVALGWEIGHYNRFMRKDGVRVPIVVPAAAKYSQQVIDTFARVVKKIMDAK